MSSQRFLFTVSEVGMALARALHADKRLALPPGYVEGDIVDFTTYLSTYNKDGKLDHLELIIQDLRLNEKN